MPKIRVAEEAGVGVRGEERPSEDVVAVLGNAVLLLDGATNLTPGLPSGGWYAGKLRDRLVRALEADPHAALRSVLEKAIQGLAADEGLVPGSSPSSTVAMARWTDERVDALVLCDSPIVAFGADGPRPLVDDRVRRLPSSRHTYQQLLRDGAGYSEGHVGALRTGMATTASRYRNREEGFWVAEADPAAASHAEYATWARDEVEGLVLASDGVSCGVDDYGIFDWPDVYSLARREGPGAVLAAVRQAEREDPHGRRWPRPKCHDDQALVLVEGL